MMKRSSGFAILAVLLGMSQVEAALTVTGGNTNGGTADFASVPYSDFVHFTGTANNSSGSVAPTLSAAGIPNTAVTGGTAFILFSDTYSNGGGSGEISQPDNPSAVEVFYGAGPGDLNKRLWFGAWGSTESASFDVAIPAASGSLAVYAGGYAGGTDGGGSLSATIGASSGSATVLRSGHGTGGGYWAGLFTVNWLGETPGDVLSATLANVPVIQSGYGSGNTGLIAAAIRPPSTNVIPEPSTLAIWSLLATLGIGLGWRRRRQAA